MGRPANYSAELPVRCQALIEKYGTIIAADDDPRFRGPLKTTFLLALATPMVVLPIERIFLARGGRRVADDGVLDPRLARHVQTILGPGKAFGEAPFFQDQAWRFVPDWAVFNVGGVWPGAVLDALASAGAVEAARQTEAHKILSCLRNALAHGGITYLDANGRHTLDATEMLGFASWARRDADPRLALLRISVANFESFLSQWTAWLSETGVGDALDVAGPGYFTVAAE